MKLLTATLAAAVAQASTGYSDAVFPAAGQHVVYSVHDTLPQGRSLDQTLTLTGGQSSTMTVEAPGKAPVHIAMEDGGLSRMDRSIGMSVHWLEVTDAVVQAALAGRRDTEVAIGPPGSSPVRLGIISAGGTITASGTVTLPPPPMERGEHGRPPQGGPPQGAPPENGPDGPPQGGPNRRSQGAGNNMMINVRIVATIANGRLAKATGELTPANGHGPRHSWIVSRKN